MPIFTYGKYLELLPDDTRTFVRRLISYLSYKDSIQLNDFSIVDKYDKLFFKAIKAYKVANERNRSIIQVLGFNEKKSFSFDEMENSTASKIFSEYYKAFVPFENEEDYLALRPEDIIKNIHDNLLPDDCTVYTFKVLDLPHRQFIKRLIEMNANQKNELVEGFNKKFNNGFTIAVINYYDMVGRIYTYLRANKDKIQNVQNSIIDLKNLAMLLAIFYYNHVSCYQDTFNEKEIIIKYFNSKGLTIEKIEEAIGLHIDMAEIEKINPTLVLYRQFTEIKSNVTDEGKTYVGPIVHKLINNGFNESFVIKKVLGCCGLTLKEVSKINETLKVMRDEISSVTVEELNKGLMPDTINYLKRISKLYAYIKSKIEPSENALIENKNDMFALAILLSSFEFENKFNTFFTEKGLTVEKILEIANLPTKETFEKEVEQTLDNEREITRFNVLVTGGVNEEKPKDTITPLSIITNSSNKKCTHSSLYQKIYKMVTGGKLNDSFNTQVDNYFKEKEYKRKKALTEEVLQDVQIDVFNYLKIVSDYYQIFSNFGLDQKDQEQLAIIFGASRYNEAIELFFDNLGMDRDSMATAADIDFEYTEKPFNIDIITGPLKPYIFDRPNAEITVYSILENAFRPELTNTLNLRNFLHKFGKTPEEFTDIKKAMSDQNQKLIVKAEKEALDAYYDSIVDDGLPIMEDALRIYEYLTNLKNRSQLIKTPEDIKLISILISLFFNDTDYIPFFVHNGVTLDVICEILELKQEEIQAVRAKEYNKKTIFEFKDYLITPADKKILVHRMFTEDVAKSNILELITEKTDNKYEYLAEEVEQQKERDITPDQGIKILLAEEVEELEDTSLGTIAQYGSKVSKHSKYINDALHGIMSADTLDHSVEGLNSLLGEVTTEEELPSQKKRNFLARFFKTEEPKPKTIRKINVDKLDDVQEEVSEQVETLTTELKGYEFIKKYIEVFLGKLYEHLENLKKYYKTIEDETVDESLDEIEQYTKTLDINSKKEIVLDKINSFETMILLMKQELVTVHRSIINHFMTINSLQTSKSAILPLIVTEVAIGVGKRTEEESMALTGDLIGLFQSVVSKNAEATKANLEKISLLSLSDETYMAMNKEVNSYLESLDRGRAVLAESTKTPEPPKVLEAPTLPTYLSTVEVAGGPKKLKKPLGMED